MLSTVQCSGANSHWRALRATRWRRHLRHETRGSGAKCDRLKWDRSEAFAHKSVPECLKVSPRDLGINVKGALLQVLPGFRCAGERVSSFRARYHVIAVGRSCRRPAAHCQF